MEIDDMAYLEKGWDSYKAEPPSLEARQNAKAFLNEAHIGGFELDEPRVAPSVIGGIGVTFRKDDRKVYIEFYNKGKVLAMFCDDRIEEVDDLEITEVVDNTQTLTKIKEWLKDG